MDIYLHPEYEHKCNEECEASCEYCGESLCLGIADEFINIGDNMINIYVHPKCLSKEDINYVCQGCGKRHFFDDVCKSFIGTSDLGLVMWNCDCKTTVCYFINSLNEKQRQKVEVMDELRRMQVLL